jgi:hypothetical protein
MTILSSPARPVLTVSPFGQAVRTFLQASHCRPAVIAEALAYVEANGTATGSVVPVELQRETNQIIRDKTGDREYDSAEDFPAAWDEVEWGTTDSPLPPRGTVPEADAPIVDSQQFPAPQLPTVGSSPPDPWTATPLEPLSTPAPTRHEWARPFEPSPAERLYWTVLRDREERLDRRMDGLAEDAAALELLTRGLDPYSLPALCGGSPADEVPVKVSPARRRPNNDITDEDHMIAHGCV